MSRRPGRIGLIAVVTAALLLGACSSGGDDDAVSTTTTIAKKVTTVERPDGPKSTLSPLTGGDGVFIGSATPTALPESYVQEEFTASGNATSYTPEGELTEDGRWTVRPDQAADYKTRVLVRRPKDPKDFSGTVVVEWLNVSGGVDADPDFVTLREELLRQGHAWVGVSAQAIGVEGGPVAVKVDTAGSEAAGKGLKAIDPARYGALQHPGDAFSFDIYSQVARAVRAGDGLGDLEPARVIALGESQSAFALTSYINGVQPLTHAFDGFFVHSRGGPALPFVKPGAAADIAGAIGGKPAILRTDTDVPILDLQTESDVAGILNSASARQPDSDRFRLWEVTGTAHADKHLMGPTADTVDCGVPVNDGPLHIVGKAAFRHLDDWVRDGKQPPKMPRITLSEGAAPAVVRDQDGIAEGGVRTPPVDVPTRALSGQPGPSSSVICILLGSTKPIAAARLAALYPSRQEFQRQYDAAVDDAIAAGVVLREDRAALEGYAHAELVGS
jgi:Alpha/beta hydrolase domain